MKAKATDSRRKGKESQIGCKNITCLKNPQIPRALGLGANRTSVILPVAGFLEPSSVSYWLGALRVEKPLPYHYHSRHSLVYANNIHIGNRSVWFADSRLVFGPRVQYPTT